jgi:hypothetical protein
MSKFNIDNSGKNMAVYHPQADPSGKCIVWKWLEKWFTKCETHC